MFPDRKGKDWRPRSSDRIRAHLAKLELPTVVAGKKIDFHSTRRFFATSLARAGVESAIRKRLMGHSLGGDVTEANYIERELEQLYEAVCRIKLPTDGGRPGAREAREEGVIAPSLAAAEAWTLGRVLD